MSATAVTGFVMKRVFFECDSGYRQIEREVERQPVGVMVGRERTTDRDVGVMAPCIIRTMQRPMPSTQQCTVHELWASLYLIKQPLTISPNAKKHLGL